MLEIGSVLATKNSNHEVRILNTEYTDKLKLWARRVVDSRLESFVSS